MFFDFEFDGEKASDYGLIVGIVGGSSGTETVSSGADLTFNQAKASGSNHFYLHSYTYENPYTLTFQVVKNPCLNHDMYFSSVEISSIQRWLCRKDGFYKFKVDDKDYLDIYWMGTFSSKQITLNGQTIGLELTLTTDSPYAYLDEIVINIDCSSATSENPTTFDIYDMSDEEGYICPYVKVTFLENISDENIFKLKNSMAENHTTALSCGSYGESITFDGQHQIIDTDSVNLKQQISKKFNYQFPRIVNTYKNNKNTFTCNCKCLIAISYSPIKKVGL